ncbi:MAG: protoheme IX farnesyltransferase [Deltaproteobacteria bacterium]|nr:protoheme IX farnesyltransferase [Deltaproteobacteria bacterium]
MWLRKAWRKRRRHLRRSRLAVSESVAAQPNIAREMVQLAKPRITALVVFTTACGLWFAPRSLGWRGNLLTLVGTVLVVAAANALNMYLERDTDALMSRTKNRPLPAGRLAPSVALKFGLVLAAISVPLLTFAVGPLPGLLASVALVSYVLLYTPMKRRSTASLLVGAIPGAIPPVIGWTAAMGKLELPAALLFALMFLWQVPHFLAITLFRAEEYARAGLVVAPNEPGGERTARADIVRYTVALWGTSLLFVPIGAAGKVYFAVAIVSGAAFTGLGLVGLKRGSGPKWAKQLFLLSLVYITAVMAALVLDRGT